MPEHRFGPGRLVIDRLAALGVGLGYEVTAEDHLRFDSSQAVDLVWRAGGSTGGPPLFVFEVESTVTNSSVANAVKVFGTDLDKPLFLFHVYVSGGADSQRIAQLQATFGTHNYRVYRLGQGEMVRLINDVISQHRRLTPRINVNALCSLLDRWGGVQRSDVLDFMETADFGLSQPGLCYVYGHRAKTDLFYRERFLRRVLKSCDPESPASVPIAYPTYFGDWWSVPLHLGLSAAVNPARGAWYLQQLRRWNEETDVMDQIGPYLGLSEDYDNFLGWIAPPFLGLMGALMRRVPGANSYVLRQIQRLLSEIEWREPTRAFLSTWALHIALACSDSDYEDVRSTVCNAGGLPESMVGAAPDVGPSEEDDVTLYASGERFVDVPDARAWRDGASRKFPNESVDVVGLAIALLVDDVGFMHSGGSIVKQLLAVEG